MHTFRPDRRVPDDPYRREHRRRVVIIGAGFAGLSAAKALRKMAFDVIVIDQHNMAQFRYGATSTCRQSAGRSASLIGGFGGEGGSGLGCSTASVNHQSSSFPQPSSGDGGGWS